MEEGTKFKVAPHVDQTMVYDSVFERLSAGGCIGIFLREEVMTERSCFL
jgi:glycerol-3-phosphate O-acyltransferase/dihydroxyacetone phosphate acyltransferase